jgi:hypothetical protein
VTQPVPAGTILVGTQHDDTTVTLIVGGGTDGEEATFTIRATTSLGEIFEDTVALPISIKVTPEVYSGIGTPTPANLIALFPEFGALSRDQLQYYLDRAGTFVGDGWSVTDAGHAQMLMAAHLLTLSGLGATPDALAIANGSGEFRSMSIGSLSLSRFDSFAGKANMDLTSTRYGREFRALLRRNRGGPRVTGTLSIGGGDGDRSQFPTYPWNNYP